MRAIYHLVSMLIGDPTHVVTRSQAKLHLFLFATKRGQNSHHRQILDIVPCLYSLLLMPTRAFNHVAVSVTDIDSAMRWYRDVIQMTPLVEPTEITTYEKEQQLDTEPSLY
jgi:hypothetical protein